MRYKTRWKTGDKTKLARAAGISPSRLSDILHGHKTCPARLAAILEDKSTDLGYRMPKAQWAFQEDRTANPLFPQWVDPKAET